MKLEARFPFKSEFDATKSDIGQEILRCALKKRKVNSRENPIRKCLWNSMELPVPASACQI